MSELKSSYAIMMTREVSRLREDKRIMRNENKALRDKVARLTEFGEKYFALQKILEQELDKETFARVLSRFKETV